METRFVYITDSAEGFRTLLFPPKTYTELHLLLFLLPYCIAYIGYLERPARYLIQLFPQNDEPNVPLGYQRQNQIVIKKHSNILHE